MYNALTPLFNHVTAADLNADFKPEPVGAAVTGPLTPEAVPHPGVTILRDQYNVPHIYGATRDDVTWGSGWVVAEDRGLLLQEARYDALVAAIDAPGLSALGLIAQPRDLQADARRPRTRSPSRRTRCWPAGAEGREVLHDIDVYLEGINAYNAINSPSTPPFTRTDIYAFNALKDQFVGEGGGQQTANGEFLSSLEQRLGAKKGFKVWNDLREANDPEAPASVPGHVQFQPPPKSLSGNVMLAPNSLTSGASDALAVQRDFKGHASQRAAGVRPSARPRTIRSWSPVRRSATTTRA